ENKNSEPKAISTDTCGSPFRWYLNTPVSSPAAKDHRSPPLSFMRILFIIVHAVKGDAVFPRHRGEFECACATLAPGFAPAAAFTGDEIE
ncbi:hypothetical protein, partial [Burkholderia pseudomallei]|uniref:hypothetical protein n=1 Tax=Burkholderia pseudomallei TaxID=28450 RepID=UPI001C3D1C8D